MEENPAPESPKARKENPKPAAGNTEEVTPETNAEDERIETLAEEPKSLSQSLRPRWIP
jgi:hypothetical protein